MDFVSAHYGAIPAAAMRSPKQFTHPLVVRAKLDISAACHAHGKIASHNVTTEIKDLSVVANDALYAKLELGFNRMWSIHPDQIRPILDAYAPTADEVNDALQILLAAQAQNWGPIQHKDKLHDRASYRYYWTLLQQARQSGLVLPDSANSLV
jgi:citrate lyase subunit beta/citryl-CoA lyase